MTKKEFYKEAMLIVGRKEADAMLTIMEDYCAEEKGGEWDEEAASCYIADVLEEYRYCASLDHYRDCGY